MAITLRLTPEQQASLKAVASTLHVSPEAPAETAVRDLPAPPDEAEGRSGVVATIIRRHEDGRRGRRMLALDMIEGLSCGPAARPRGGAVVAAAAGPDPTAPDRNLRVLRCRRGSSDGEHHSIPGD